MKRIIIAAMTRDHVIGADSGIPWNVPADYQQFLDAVRDQTMIMGRKSWEIFGGDVDTAYNIVISHSAQFPDVDVVDSLPAALKLADEYQKTTFIAGGATIYQQALDADAVDEMHLSIIPGEFAGDTYFPEFDASAWHLVETRPEPGFTFIRYRRQH